MRLIVGVLLCLAALTETSRAASFDCAKAATPVEKMVCGDSALSKADEALAQAYAAALAATLDTHTLRTDQVEWIGRRNKLTTVVRLLESYQHRIEDLTTQAGAWRQVPREVVTTSAKTSCLELPHALVGDLTCKVDAFDAVDRAIDATLFYQIQTYHDADMWSGSGVVVFKAIGGKPGSLTPLTVVFDDTSHYEAPYLNGAATPHWLLIPGHVDGTGNFNAEAMYLYDNDRLEDVDTLSWQTDLGHRLPKGMAVWKGVYPNYDTMTAETPIWKDGDGNCCPTGGRAFVTLSLIGHRLKLTHVAIKLGEAAARPDD
jgi:uncharacterized protein